MFVRSTILAAAALVAGTAAVPALAQGQETVTISYADLNLANQAGREAFDRRIAGAVAELCGAVNPVELGRAAIGRACIAETLAAVQPQRDAAIGHRGTVEVANLTVRVSRAAN